MQTKTTTCLTIELEAILPPSGNSYLLLPLNCPSFKLGTDRDVFYAILLVWIEGKRYMRARPQDLFEVYANRISRDTTIYIVKAGG